MALHGRRNRDRTGQRAVRAFTRIDCERERTGYGYELAVRGIDVPRLWDALRASFDGFYVNVEATPMCIAPLRPGPCR